MRRNPIKTRWLTIRSRFRLKPKKWGALILASLIIGYCLYLGAGVVNEFEQRHWDVPAAVYAAPMELHVGLELSPTELATALAQTGYQSVDTLQQPGEFRVGRNSARVWTRAFRFWDGVERSGESHVEFERGRITAMRDAGDQPVPLLRLEPLRLGSLFAVHHEDRILVGPAEIPPLLKQALIAVEDRKFEHHNGIDFAAIARAAWVNLRHREVRQGGSTLTQQLVKSYFLDGRQTLSRKAREAVMAVALEMRYDKQEILHAYVNEIYLGQQGARAIHGFGLASEFYFSKHLNELSVGEIALLVAMLKGPSFYDPRRHPARARERRDLVLTVLAQRDVIDESLADAARQQSLGVTGRDGVSSRYQPAYMDLVRKQLATDYSAGDLATQGLRVFTALDPRAQAVAERELGDGLERLETELAAASESAPGTPLEGAVVITRPQTGEVIAVVGGRSAGVDGFNRAFDAKRPVGSLIKPLVYLAALESGGYTLASPLLDEPIDVPMPNGDVWSPNNFSLESHGEVPLVRALASSYNQATVRLGLDVGVDKVADLFERLGLESAPAAYPSLLLGAVELSTYEIAQLYNSLANGGDRIALKAVRSVTDANGAQLNRYPLELIAAADADAIHQLNHALIQVVEHGTGRPARNILPRDMTVAAKTGTSDDFKDSWFAGFSNSYLTVVWVGRDDNTPVGLTGSGGALTVWAPILANLSPNTAYRPVESPTLERTWVDYGTGFATRRGCRYAVLLPMPPNADLPRQAGCGPGIGELGDRVTDWLDNLGNRQ